MIFQKILFDFWQVSTKEAGSVNSAYSVTAGRCLANVFVLLAAKLAPWFPVLEAAIAVYMNLAVAPSLSKK